MKYSRKLTDECDPDRESLNARCRDSIALLVEGKPVTIKSRTFQSEGGYRGCNQFALKTFKHFVNSR
jgi:hypothetical protein